MQDTQSATSYWDSQRLVRMAIAAVIVTGLALVGFGFIGASSTHKAGAATGVAPHALAAGSTLSMSATGVTGEGVTGQPGTIEIDSWQWGVSRAVITSSAGAGAGKISFNPFSITRKIDLASPTFFKNCVAGAHIKSVILYVRKSGGGSSLTLSFNNVLVSSVIWSDAGGTDYPSETVNMVPASYTVQYTPVSPAG